MAEKTKVAIVGGGCGALSAAFELSKPEHAAKYDITVYQMGWRLGGKGASSRGPYNRIEEHGLHLWLGFYENAFRQIRSCYEELGRDAQCPIATFEQAFFPDPVVSIADRDQLGEWDVWTVEFPPGNGTPGDLLKETNPFSVKSYISKPLGLLLELLRSLDTTLNEEANEPVSRDVMLDRAERIIGLGQLAGLAAFVQVVELIRGLVGFGGNNVENTIADLVERAQEFASNQLLTLVHGDPALRRLWTVFDLMLAATRGIIRFGLMTDSRGFDAIDDYDLMEWLEYNGAHPTSTRSGFLRGSCYDLTFAYREGDIEQPAFAAGVGVRCSIRMYFGYRGSMFWKMGAGMGETVFAPLYEVLRARGVKFEFFHRLENVAVEEDQQGAHVSSLVFEQQAQVKNGEYSPLIDVHGLPSWPDRPLYDQLECNHELLDANLESENPVGGETKTLKVSKDFDFVVLGISLGSIPGTCSELISRDNKWRDMVENLTTIGTQSSQLWLNRTVSELGYEAKVGNLSGFVSPFDTWADMSHLSKHEDLPEPVKSIAYFCSVLPDSEDDPEYVKANMRRFLDNELRALWRATPGHAFNDQWLVGDDNDRFGSQYFRANRKNSERYVQSLPGTTKYRISPLDRTYDNLTIAGDWTANSINAGCVEAAVISGMLAAHAISGFPLLEDIIGFDHP